MSFLIRMRIRQCISILSRSSDSGVSPDTISLLYSKKYASAMQILEDSGYISCIRSWGSHVPVSVAVKNTGFSVYKLNRHDVWMNRLWGFLAGVAFSVLADLTVRFLL